MKLFEMKQIHEAITHSKYGGQALHVHTLNVGHRLFRRYPVIGHLFDMDKKRLQRTAVKLASPLASGPPMARTSRSPVRAGAPSKPVPLSA